LKDLSGDIECVDLSGYDGLPSTYNELKNYYSTLKELKFKLNEDQYKNAYNKIKDLKNVKYSYLKIIVLLINKKFGRIVNIGSIWSHISKEKRAAYSASKSALESLARSITSEYGRFGIIANTVSPGFILTDLTKQNNTDEEMALLKNTVPLNKLGEPNQVAELVYFLCNNNNYIAGQNITIDGGYTCVA
jgi:NAD(P)-dependent dehydrogenase (short-subunit alcohol dehydrogenase family)